MYAQVIQMVESQYLRVPTIIMIDPAYFGRVDIESSDLPDGVTVAFQGVQLVVFGTPIFGSVGDWPVALQFRLTDGDLSFPRILINIQIQSVDDLESDKISDLAASLGDYYYELCGGPLRKEMRDGF